MTKPGTSAGAEKAVARAEALADAKTNARTFEDAGVARLAHVPTNADAIVASGIDHDAAMRAATPSPEFLEWFNSDLRDLNIGMMENAVKRGAAWKAWQEATRRASARSAAVRTWQERRKDGNSLEGAMLLEIEEWRAAAAPEEKAPR